MAETLGSLCDKLTIVKLKQWHSSDEKKLASLHLQAQKLSEEIDEYLFGAISGLINSDKIRFPSNKVYNEKENLPREFIGTIGTTIFELATVNCELWHEQEKVYEFDKVAPDDKNKVIKKLAILNLERNKCIESIDNNLYKLIEASKNDSH